MEPDFLAGAGAGEKLRLRAVAVLLMGTFLITNATAKISAAKWKKCTRKLKYVENLK